MSQCHDDYNLPDYHVAEGVEVDGDQCHDGYEGASDDRRESTSAGCPPTA